MPKNSSELGRISYNLLEFVRQLRAMRHRFVRTLAFLASTLFSLLMLLLVSLLFYILLYLPKVEQLDTIQLQVPLRIYSSEHRLIAEFGEKRRLPVTLNQVPQSLIQAVLATEDQRFYEHEGIDPFGLVRAAIQLAVSGRKSQGGSTITMQVARNFFLSRKKTYLRKFNEILLALKIDRKLTKKRILELYLNKIFLGHRAYGVAAAAQVYYGQPLSKLNLSQLAMIAGLPKAPSSLNPLSNPERALKRRNHVLKRMLEQQYITKQTYQKATSAPITARYHEKMVEVQAPYVAEMVRQTLYDRFGEQAYSQGFQVMTTLNADLQQVANKTLQQGLVDYDHRHGYQGPLQHTSAPPHEVEKVLSHFPAIQSIQPALVKQVTQKQVGAILKNNQPITLFWKGLSWARPRYSNGYVGPYPTDAKQILKPGDIIDVTHQSDQWALTQMPNIQGALVALNPNNGAIQALTGGFNYALSAFNRAIQSHRQSGSAIKPFLYAAALEHGMTLATMINDAPIIVDDPNQEKLWRPQNDNRLFSGPTRLRVGLIKSRNLVSIRILKKITLPFSKSYFTRFGIPKNQMPDGLSLALGTGTLTPLQMSVGYAVIANGGFRIYPYLIQTIMDESGKVIEEALPDTVMSLAEMETAHLLPALQVISPQIAYLMTSAMQDVIKKGTGRRALVLHRHDLSGKTGTTNDQKDAWFSGFNRRLVSTVWIGYDQPQSLHEYGAQVALPIWIQFMGQALRHQPEAQLKEPAGLIRVRINPETGQLATSEEKNSIFEIFRTEYAPKAKQTDSPNEIPLF